ncbi:carbonic anhydrase 2-like [Galleria mellonella]|uniref:Carbonic anhydrase n=1 Tax=Galleria mellonella TaxID=7137 RepID=A0ABM3N3U2_GALME|nr:carbonic anhydrase 2-like [Galleria mellonella]
MLSSEVLILLCLCGLSLSHQMEWSYDYETQWPGVCNSGFQQSPINIMTRDAVLDIHGSHIRGPLVFRGYGNVAVSAINNGHTLKWNVVENSTAPVLSGGPLRGNYTLLQFHLHWLSEHAIDGMKYPLEIHMVHVKTGLTLDEALERPDGLAVIGVITKVVGGYEEASSFALEEIMPVVPDLLDQNVESSEILNIDMNRLFSPEPQSFYTYHGSLTTPLCQEVVTWIIMDKPLTISDTQYKVFSKVNVGGIDNYRSLQRSNRVVYRSVASCSYALSPSILGVLVTVFRCLASKVTQQIHKGICYIGNAKRKIFGNTLIECSKVHIS